MLHLYGCQVGEHDALWLVERLRDEDNPDALTAAAAIQKALDRGLYTIALARDEREAIFAVLEDPPTGLGELRGRLLRDLQ